MILETTKNNLTNGLQFVVGTAGKNVNLQILNNILIEVKTGSINLIVTNLELGITSAIRGKVEKPGSFTVPARLLIDFVNTLPEGNIKIVQKSNNLIITSGRQRGSIRGVSAEDFPLIPKTEETKATILPSQTLLGGLLAVAATISTNETRPEISGCLFKFNGNELTLVGTDSFRLCEKKVKVDKNVHSGQSIIIPLKTAQELMKVINLSIKLQLEGDKVEIFASDNQVLFKLPNIEMVSRLIDGTYPDYQQIIPNSYNQMTIINTAGFIQAVRGVAIFSEQGIFDIELKGRGDKLVICAKANQSGEGEASLNAQITGGDFQLILNSRYLLDSLSTINTEETSLEVTSADTPCILRPYSKTADNSQLYVIMPIKQ